MDLGGGLLVPLQTIDQLGSRSYVYRTRRRAPAVWWPAEVQVAASSAEAFRRVAGSASGSLVAVVPEAVVHVPGGQVEVAGTDGPDRISLRVSGEGGLVVVRRAFQGLLRAGTADHDLAILPVNLGLVGVVVPPGDHDVVVEVDSRPELVAAGVSCAVVLVLLVVLVFDARARVDARVRTRDPAL